MANDTERIYWDACVFLSYVNGIAGRVETIDELLNQARAGNFELLTSSLSHAEVAFAAIEKEQGRLHADVEQKIDDLWRPGSPIKTVEFYDLIGLEARRVIRQGITQGWGLLKPADAMHLATARKMNVSQMQTYDDRLLKWDGRLSFPIRKPFASQLPLSTGG